MGTNYGPPGSQEPPWQRTPPQVPPWMQQPQQLPGQMSHGYQQSGQPPMQPTSPGPMHLPPPPMQPGSLYPGYQPPMKPPSKKKPWYRTGCGITVIVLVVLLLWAIGNAATQAAQNTAIVITPQATLSAATQPSNPLRGVPTATSIPATAFPTATPILTPTQAAVAHPTSLPTPTPTHIAQPPTPTPVPRPTVPPAPTPTSPPTGVNGNPWGYDFNTPGNLITNPPASFCDGTYFVCVTTFWTATNGYVVECVDGVFSHSGGVRGACSHHGGVGAILYSH